MRICRLAWPFLLAVVVIEPAAGATIVRDATGRSVAINDASRVVSIGGAITEILYALGMEKRVIAVDTTSLYPPRALAEKPNVGYMRQLSPEGVVGLSPSLILASEGAGPKETMAVIDAATIPIVRVPDDYTGEGILKKIELVAAALGVDKKGRCLASEVNADLAALARLRSHITTPAKIMFVLSFVNDRAMVAGKNTAADGVIQLAGGVNAISEFEGYKIVSDEAIIAARPEIVLAMERPQQTLSAASVFANPAFQLTPAGVRKSFISMDGLYLLGFGPRTARAARDLALALYPELGREGLPSERQTAGACAR